MGLINSKTVNELSSENRILKEENLQLKERLVFLEDEIQKIKTKSNISPESADALEKKLQGSVSKLVDNILKNDSINSVMIPDYIERKIYTNVFTVLISMIKEILEDTNINIFNQNIKFQMSSQY